ncbi:MAG: cysteine desulfurase [Calditrichaeota bacterium]|nr:MAG: cysteine desulfurase [Calditrichota bacterium]
MNLIYMDHHATTPLDPEVLDAMMPYLTTEFGNPSSNTHEMGHFARIAVEKSRTQLALLIGASSPDEIVFTSGATEADNLALKGIVRAFKERSQPNIVTIAIEHKAILDTAKSLQKEGVEIRFAKIDSSGLVDLDDFKRKIDAKTILISIQTANSEIGVVQPVNQIGKIAREHNVLLHTDAVQALGRIDVNVLRDNIDLLSISGHKMYGPKGVGGLYVRKGVRLVPMIDGGGHERGMRSGTLNVPGIVGLGKAAEIAKRDLLAESSRLTLLRDMLALGIAERIDQAKLNGHPTRRLPNNLNFAFAYVEGEALLLACKGFALSTGSACTSTSLQSSYVLKAIGVPDHLAHSSIRFGLGKSNNEDQIELLLHKLETSVKRLREMSPLYDMAKEGINIDNYQWPHSH